MRRPSRWCGLDQVAVAAEQTELLIAAVRHPEDLLRHEAWCRHARISLSRLADELAARPPHPGAVQAAPCGSLRGHLQITPEQVGRRHATAGVHNLSDIRARPDWLKGVIPTKGVQEMDLNRALELFSR